MIDKEDSESAAAVTAEDAAESASGTPPTRRRGRTKPRRAREGEEGVHRTRISGVWTAVAVAVVFGVALIDFIVQNTRSVHIEFFSASGRMPVAVAILAAALAGAFVVLAVGMCRTAQLRLAVRRKRRQPPATDSAPIPAKEPA